MAKILVGEDDRTTRAVIASIVTRLGHTPVEASNGRLCWEILKDNPDTALVITDILMPEMNGRQLIGMLRSDERLQSIPVIIASGIVSLRQIDDLLQLGATRFLPKPIDIGMLQHYIASLLERDTPNFPPENHQVVR